MLVLADGGRFTDEQHRLRYCFSLLKGDVYTTLEPHVSTAGAAFTDVTAFLAEITKIFGDSDEKSTAARERAGKTQAGKPRLSRLLRGLRAAHGVLGLGRGVKETSKMKGDYCVSRHQVRSIITAHIDRKIGFLSVEGHSQQARQMYNFLFGTAFTKSSTGWIFEGRVHACLRRGGTLC